MGGDAGWPADSQHGGTDSANVSDAAALDGAPRDAERTDVPALDVAPQDVSPAPDVTLDAAPTDVWAFDATPQDVVGPADAEPGDVALSDAQGADAGGGTGTVGPRITSFTPSGPITVSTGQIVTGLHITAANGPCIQGSNVTNVHIHDNRIGPCGASIDPNGIGISMEDAAAIQIDHNSFDDIASAFYVTGYNGGGSDLYFHHNHATRIRGPLPRGQLVQFNNVRGSGNQILCNVSEQTSPGYGAGPEDHINMFSSQGTPASPIRYAYNKIRGGGPSQSGGGMLAGDNDGAYFIMESNILIDPGQYGIAVAGGHDVQMLNNKVYSPTAHAWSNNGAFVWNQYAPPCYNITARGNRVYYINRDGLPNAGWNAGNCGTVAGWDTDNNWTDQTLSESIWDEVFPECQE